MLIISITHFAVLAYKICTVTSLKNYFDFILAHVHVQALAPGVLWLVISCYRAYMVRLLQSE